MAPNPGNINEEISSEVAQRLRGGDAAEIEAALRDAFLAQGIQPDDQFIKAQAQRIAEI